MGVAELSTINTADQPTPLGNLTTVNLTYTDQIFWFDSNLPDTEEKMSILILANLVHVGLTSTGLIIY